MSPVAVLMNIISRFESDQGCLSIETGAPERGGLPEDQKAIGRGLSLLGFPQQLGSWVAIILVGYSIDP